MSAHDAYVSGASERYLEARNHLDRLLDERFPNVERVVDDGMPAWRIPRPAGAPRPTVSGTIDPDHVHLALVERKAGITLHLWYPPEYEVLADHAEGLEAAGWKVMKGCVQFNRKGPVPVDAIEPVLDHVVERDGF